MLIRLVRRFVLAATVGVLVVGGVGTGVAEPTEPSEVEQPRPLIAAVASCHDGSADVTVYVKDDRDEPFEVRLVSLTGSFSATKETVLDEEHWEHVTVFDGVPVGEYAVAVTEEAEGPEDGVRVAVRPCAPPHPDKDPLVIKVECRAGWGIVTFLVTNPETGESTSYTLIFEGDAQYVIPIGPGVSVQITENGFEEGTYLARLRGGEQEVTEEFTVACAQGNAPDLGVRAVCDGAKGGVSVAVTNPNRAPVTYDVALEEAVQKVSVGGGETGTVRFADVPDGDHPVLVSGSDGTEAVGVAAVECDGGSTPTTTTTTPTTTASSTSTSTTTPVPQGRSGGGLARTGSAVGEMVGFGLLVLAAGGVLVGLARRRRRGSSAGT